MLSVLTGALPQWRKEKWACRDKSKKNVVLTRGNGSQYAIVIFGDQKGLDLEDLASGQTNIDKNASIFTRVAATILALFWILLLITAGIKQNTWFLLAIGGIGILQNIFVAGWRRDPKAYGIPLTFVEVIGGNKVMDTLWAVEDKYHHVGASMLDTFFFPGGRLRPDEKTKWDNFATIASNKDEAAKAANPQNGGSQVAQTVPATNSQAVPDMALPPVDGGATSA